MSTKEGRMSAEEFRQALEMIGETVASFAELLALLGDRANDKVRTVQRWAAGSQDIPGPVQALLQLLVLIGDAHGITPDRVRELMADADPEAAPGPSFEQTDGGP